MKLCCLSIGLLLTIRALGQDYYRKPKQNHLTVSIGTNWQYLSPVSKWAIHNTQNTKVNLQMGIAYDLPLSTWMKGISINPEIILRTNNAGLTYQVPVGDIFVRNNYGYSSQFLLPLRYRHREFALSIGLFGELPMALLVKEEVNQAGTPYWFPNVNREITQIGKGWQASVEYNQGRLQWRLFLTNRLKISQDYTLLLPATQIRGGVVGYRF